MNDIEEETLRSPDGTQRIFVNGQLVVVLEPLHPRSLWPETYTIPVCPSCGHLLTWDRRDRVSYGWYCSSSTHPGSRYMDEPVSLEVHPI